MGETTELVYDAVVAALRPYAGSTFHGITCLCDGADQIFARAVVESDGALQVVLPADDYRESIVDRDDFDHFLSKAIQVARMPFQYSNRQAFRAASEELLRRSDVLFAVWDGQPSHHLGDTADVVRVARGLGVPVVVVWPEGARRLPEPLVATDLAARKEPGGG
ncbi:hypothetical protein RB614_09550 [Phytohabitans sp. ZYX-F-186]|uniref:Uncharacterized protein n=1 Tax=Phytohabitans maris TaxID=3071409 RepID=A0ABU0ZCR7_9ACTN|nr:hypothetical protein [Phytohabitans sp. ZYX-F-186]MDQ7904763.1 hypothetical protein [Phytohabitans sp. ZYX-F-186]